MMNMLTVLPTTLSAVTNAGLEGVGKEVEEGITSECSDSQGDEELDEMLVEDSLHDRDHEDSEHPAEGDYEDSSAGRKPGLVVVYLFVLHLIVVVVMTFVIVMVVIGMIFVIVDEFLVVGLVDSALKIVFLFFAVYAAAVGGGGIGVVVVLGSVLVSLGIVVVHAERH